MFLFLGYLQLLFSRQEMGGLLCGPHGPVIRLTFQDGEHSKGREALSDLRGRGGVQAVIDFFLRSR